MLNDFERDYIIRSACMAAKEASEGGDGHQLLKQALSHHRAQENFHVGMAETKGLSMKEGHNPGGMSPMDHRMLAGDHRDVANHISGGVESNSRTRSMSAADAGTHINYAEKHYKVNNIYRR